MHYLLFARAPAEGMTRSVMDCAWATGIHIIVMVPTNEEGRERGDSN